MELIETEESKPIVKKKETGDPAVKMSQPGGAETGLEAPVRKVPKTGGREAGFKKQVILKKLDAETAKLLGQLKDRANKKNFGRKVRDSEILFVALKQITAEHIKMLQDQTLSEKDKLGIAHEEYQKTNGKITMDAFIGKLLKGEFKSATTS